MQTNFAWTLFGTLVSNLCQWGLLASLAKNGGPEMAGLFILGLAIASPTFQLFDLQLKVVLASDAKHDYSFGEYMAVRLIGVLCGIVSVALIATTFYGYGQESLVVIAIGFSSGAELIGTLIYGLFQKHERMSLTSISMMAKSVSNLVCVTLAVVSTQSLLVAAVTLGLSKLFWTAIYDAPRAAELLSPTHARTSGGGDARASRYAFGSMPVNGARLFRLASTAFPLGINVFLGTLSYSVPRYFVEHCCGLRPLGIYGSIAYVTVVLNAITMSLIHAAIPSLSRHFVAKQRKEFAWLAMSLLCFLVAVLVVGGVVVRYFGGDILSLLYTPEFSLYGGLFMALYLSGCLQSVSAFAVGYLIALRQLKVQALLGAISLVATLVASAILIPRFELLGAAYTTIVAFGIYSIIALVLCVRAVRSIPEAP